MTTLVRIWRGAAVLLIPAAVAVSAQARISDGTFEFFNFFGFFTIQSNLIAAAVLAVSLRWTGQHRPLWLEYARACATGYMIIVAIVYWILLAGVDVQIASPWANIVLHAVAPAVMLADWLLEGPAKRLPLSKVWVVLIYPTVWLAVILVRGATDGWVPYPFLDPTNGYGSISVVSLGIMAAGIAIGALVFRATGWRRAIPHAE